MDRLALGFTPWWGSAEGRIRFTAIAEGARSLWRAAWPVVRGAESPLFTWENGYISGSFEEIEVAMTGGVLLDGETAMARHDAPMRLTVGPRVLFVRGGAKDP